MSYMSNLKKTTNIGKKLHKRWSIMRYVCIFIIILVVLSAGLCVFFEVSNTGYKQFSSNMQPGLASQTTITRLFKLLSDTENKCTYCMYFNDDTCGIILFPNEILNNELMYLLRYSKDDSTTPIVVQGLSCSFDNSFKKAVENDVLLSNFSDTYGTVYLDATIKVYPTYLLPTFIACITLVVVYIAIQIFFATRAMRLLKNAALLTETDENAFIEFDSRLNDKTNIAFNKDILITHEFYLNIKHIYFFKISDIVWCYATDGKSAKLYVHLADGRKFMLVKSDENKNANSAMHLLDILNERCNIKFIGYSKENKAAYNAYIKELKTNVE